MPCHNFELQRFCKWFDEVPASDRANHAHHAATQPVPRGYTASTTRLHNRNTRLHNRNTRLHKQYHAAAQQSKSACALSATIPLGTHRSVLRYASDDPKPHEYSLVVCQDSRYDGYSGNSEYSVVLHACCTSRG
jgi:hypothetical protein